MHSERTAQELRATSDALESDARRLAELEQTKQGLQADDPRIQVLSREGAELTERIAALGEAELELSEELADPAGR